MASRGPIPPELMVGPQNGRVPQVRPTAGLMGRVPLALLLRNGIEPTPQLVKDSIYAGLMHSMAGPPGSGKTLLALWLAVLVMRGGGRVLYLDTENGPRLVAERLLDLGADKDVLDDLFFYYRADLTLDPEDLSRLAATVAEARPALVVFDSFADFIAAAGLEENSNTDCTLWVSQVAQPLKNAGTAVLILDHVPKNSKGPRGAGAKVAKMDVVWNVETTLAFDRVRTGEITLTNSKDREAWLPKSVRFSVGGGVFARSADTVEGEVEDGITDKQRQALDYLKERGDEGASWTELLNVLGGSSGTLSAAVKRLTQLNLIEKRNGRYHVWATTEPTGGPDKPNTGGSVGFDRGSAEGTEPGASGEVQSGSALPVGSRPTEPGAPSLGYRTIGEGLKRAISGPTSALHVEKVVAELERSGSGPAMALETYRKKPGEERLMYLVKAVLHSRGMGLGEWERHRDTVRQAIEEVGRSKGTSYQPGDLGGRPGHVGGTLDQQDHEGGTTMSTGPGLLQRRVVDTVRTAAKGL